MKQITEDYVSYETAVLLKEKGFDEHCGTAYTTTEGYPIRIMGSTYSLEKNSDYDEFHYSMPSQSLALKWLREVYKWSIQVFPVFDNLKWCYDIYELKIQKYQSRPELLSNVDYNTYEEAVEASLLYVLKNLI